MAHSETPPADYRSSIVVQCFLPSQVCTGSVHVTSDTSCGTAAVADAHAVRTWGSDRSRVANDKAAGDLLARRDCACHEHILHYSIYMRRSE